MADLPDRIVDLHRHLRAADIPHAFGGALALAWCTRRARGTIDIDLNVFLNIGDRERILDALPEGVKVTGKDRSILRRDGQVRLWWEKVPVDLFLNTTDFHREVAQRVRWEAFNGAEVPFIACLDIAVFKVFFNRTKDWADLEEMQSAGTLNVAEVQTIIVRHLGRDDERLEALRRFTQTQP